MLGDRPAIRILYWPFALPSRMLPAADRWLRTNLDALGISYQLQTRHDLDEHKPSELRTEEVDLLLVGGGNTFRLLDAIRRNGFINPIRQFSRSGGDFYGGSAGAVVACETIEIAKGHDPNDVDLTDLRSLGLITGMEILPHFAPDQSVNASRRVRERGGAVIGLPESIGIARTGQVATGTADVHTTPGTGKLRPVLTGPDRSRQNVQIAAAINSVG